MEGKLCCSDFLLLVLISSIPPKAGFLANLQHQESITMRAEGKPVLIVGGWWVWQNLRLCLHTQLILIVLGGLLASAPLLGPKHHEGESWGRGWSRCCFLARRPGHVFWGEKVTSEAAVYWDSHGLSWSFEIDLWFYHILSCSSGSIPISKTSTWALQPPLGFLSHPRSLGGEWIQRHFSIMESNDPSIASLRQKLIKARGP